MKWLEKNWLIVAAVFVAYLWYNGSLSGILGGGGGGSSVAQTGGTSILGG
jgi:hypothetical protein